MTEKIHDHTLAKWTCGCDPILVGLLDAARHTGNIDVVIIDAGVNNRKDKEGKI